MRRRREPPVWTTSLVRLLAIAFAVVLVRGAERRAPAVQSPDAVRATGVAEWTAPAATPAAASPVRRIAGAGEAHRVSPVGWATLPFAPSFRRIDVAQAPAARERVARLDHRKTCTFPRREAGEPPRLRADDR